MGDVKDAIKGPAPKRPARPAGGKENANLLDDVRALKDEVSALTQTKDEDAAQEGDAERANNLRKAALLRATHSLLSAVETMLEDY